MSVQKPRLAIIGASYLQLPLIEKAKEKGYETHVFAWAAGDVGEAAADRFYPISIVEKDAILDACRKAGVCGICTIASDLAAITVNYVANALGLPGNSPACTEKSTNKHLMRRAFEQGGDPSPRSLLVDEHTDLTALAAGLRWPVIVKPTDRSGSRGIFKLEGPEGLADAVRDACAQGFEKKALVEEFAAGQEYSIECVSQNGVHHFLAATLKHTTGAPHFIETGHEQPSGLDEATLERVRQVVFHALDTLEITHSASHSELKIDADGTIRLIEIGGRMGGDMIGSDLVYLSTGLDFVGMVVDLACGRPLDFTPKCAPRRAASHFIFTREDAEAFYALRAAHPERIWKAGEVDEALLGQATDSGTRAGWYVTAEEV